jgi:plastocyanin
LISYTNTGFHPTTIKIKAGTTVVFKNDSTSSMWPASDEHPSHTNYPGTDATKCGAPEAVGMFDPCQPVQPGEYWSFAFTNKGAWRYHDHLNPTNRGVITVE